VGDEAILVFKPYPLMKVFFALPFVLSLAVAAQNYVYFGPNSSALMQAVTALLWMFAAVLASRTLARVSSEGLELRTPPFAPLRMIPWSSLLDVRRVGPDKMELIFTDGAVKKVPLTMLPGARRDDLVSAIAAHVHNPQFAITA
jgi:hypothetical protein